AISRLSRYTHNPSPNYLIVAKRVLRYLSGVLDYRIYLRPLGTTNGIISLQIYADTVFADDPDTR
ncbi:hypothetical protein K490DRAFT_52390, partial [Saccharata proteae CBS 121410]